VKFKALLYLSASMYIAGLVGLNIPEFAWLFRALTPFHLLSSLIILMLFHQDWNKPFIIFCMLTFLSGYLVEVLGVHTGLIFGKYQYESTLGIKLFEVPPMIGVNWLLLIYVVGCSFCRINRPVWLKIAYGALVLTMFDYLVEPIAIRLDMWSWEEGLPPVQNYIAWYVVSAGLLTLFYKMPFKKSNEMAVWIFIMQICFFGIQHFIS